MPFVLQLTAMKNAVITGSLSGLAQAVIKQLLNKGYRVFEGDLAIKEETIRGNEYLFPLDLTSDEDRSSRPISIIMLAISSPILTITSSVT